MFKEIELTEKDVERFWSKVDKKSDDECWHWTKDTLKGYGRFKVFRKGKEIKYQANRVSLYLKTNRQEEIARHTCDNPICCNPHHLLWGSQQQNIQDQIDRGRHVYWGKK